MRLRRSAWVLVALGALAFAGASPARGDAPPGATARCNDGTYSFSATHSGTCSHHGGVAQWLDGSGSAGGSGSGGESGGSTGGSAGGTTGGSTGGSSGGTSGG